MPPRPSSFSPLSFLAAVSTVTSTLEEQISKQSEQSETEATCVVAITSDTALSLRAFKEAEITTELTLERSTETAESGAPVLETIQTSQSALITAAKTATTHSDVSLSQKSAVAITYALVTLSTHDDVQMAVEVREDEEMFSSVSMKKTAPVETLDIVLCESSIEISSADTHAAGSVVASTTLDADLLNRDTQSRAAEGVVQVPTREDPATEFEERNVAVATTMKGPAEREFAETAISMATRARIRTKLSFLGSDDERTVEEEVLLRADLERAPEQSEAHLIIALRQGQSSEGDFVMESMGVHAQCRADQGVRLRPARPGYRGQRSRDCDSQRGLPGRRDQSGGQAHSPGQPGGVRTGRGPGAAVGLRDG